MLDKKEIQATLDRECPSFARIYVFGAGPVAHRDEPSDAFSESVAVQKAVTVADVIVARFSVNPQAPSLEARRWAIYDLTDQVIMHIGARRSSPARPLADFAATVRAALLSQDTPVEPSSSTTPTPVSPVDEGPPLSFPVAAEQLGVSVDTIEDMEKRGEIRTMRIAKRRKVPVAEVKRLLASAVFRFRHDR